MNHRETPHDRACRRCENARTSVRFIEGLLSAAEAEQEAANAELALYEKKPGIELPESEQLQVRPGDDPYQALRTAKLYAPTLVLMEDQRRGLQP